MSEVSISPGASFHLGAAVVPGSKSHTIRAVFMAGLATGMSTLLGALESDDTAAARRVLGQVGVEIHSDGGRWNVSGTGGRLVRPGGPLDVGESGLTARHTAALCPLIAGKTTIVGSGRLPQRPMRGVLEVVSAQGAIVDFDYPWTVTGSGGLPGGVFDVDAAGSSQMVSAVLATAPLARSRTVVTPRGMTGSHGYVEMTTGLMTAFGASVTRKDVSYVIEPTGYAGTHLTIPPDASAAVYPLAAAAITGSEVTVPGDLRGQPDHAVLAVLEEMGCLVNSTESGTFLEGPSRLLPIDIDMSDCPDAAVAVAVVCAVADGPSRLRGLGSLRLKESDRLEALRSELQKVGAVVEIEADTLSIRPGPMKAARFAPHNDHRLAMSLSLLGLRREVHVEDPQVVNKTWPGFWEWLQQTGAHVSK